MRRVLEFCKWKASWWVEQVSHREDLPAPLMEGLRAYAEEQAATERRIYSLWTAKWESARALAQPILQAALGAASAVQTHGVPAGVLDVIELDLDEEQAGNAGDSDFEE